MTIYYKLFKSENIIKGADIALKARLYVSGWMLSKELVEIRNYRSDYFKEYIIAIAFDNSLPISIVVSHPRQEAMAFTRKSYRRKGIASNLINKFNIEIKRYGDGITGSDKFWKRVTDNDILLKPS